MNKLLSVIIVCVFATSGLSQDETAESPNGLSEKEFTRLQAELQPGDPAWRSIPWRTSLLDAQRAAVEQQKPILIWAMDGHPLGCTWNNGVLDRESTLADPAIVKMLKSDFIPVAFDQWYLRKQNDAEGEFYRKIAIQGPRNDFDSTTQGFYLTDASGRLYAFNNNRGPERIRKLLQQTLQDFEPPKASEIDEGERDPKYSRKLPTGAVVVRANGKVLGGYDDPKNEWQSIFQNAISRDNFWLLADEQQALSVGNIPDSMIKRMARFHLVDNTRGEPAMWSESEIREFQTQLLNDGTMLGSFRLETKNSDRGFVGQLRGKVKFDGSGELTTFEMVASGQYWGESRYTPNGPPGKFPFAVAFRLADGTDVADSLPPQGTKGWLEGYFR